MAEFGRLGLALGGFALSVISVIHAPVYWLFPIGGVMLVAAVISEGSVRREIEETRLRLRLVFLEERRPGLPPVRATYSSSRRRWRLGRR